MTNSKDLIIISASCGKNLELSKKFQEKSNELKISSEILDLTTLNIPLFNPRIHTKKNIPIEVIELKEKLFKTPNGLFVPRNITAPFLQSSQTSSHGFQFQAMTLEIYLMDSL